MQDASRHAGGEAGNRRHQRRDQHGADDYRRAVRQQTERSQRRRQHDHDDIIEVAAGALLRAPYQFILLDQGQLGIEAGDALFDGPANALMPFMLRNQNHRSRRLIEKLIAQVIDDMPFKVGLLGESHHEQVVLGHAMDDFARRAPAYDYFLFQVFVARQVIFVALDRFFVLGVIMIIKLDAHLPQGNVVLQREANAQLHRDHRRESPVNGDDHAIKFVGNRAAINQHATRRGRDDVFHNRAQLDAALHGALHAEQNDISAAFTRHIKDAARYADGDFGHDFDLMARIRVAKRFNHILHLIA